MVSKCANPNCTARMKYLHEGRLFVVQTYSATRYWEKERGSFSAPSGNQIEYYWLCASCAHQMKITSAGTLTDLTMVPKLNHTKSFDLTCV